MGQRSARTEVELVEDDEAVPARRASGVTDDDRAPAPTRPDVSRRGRVWPATGRPLAAAAAAVAVVLVGAQLVTDARERTALAELRAVPGVRAPLPDTLTEVWRVPGDRLPLPVLPTGDPLLGARDTATGTELVALDPATGRDAWAVPLTRTPADTPDAIGTPDPVCDASSAPGTARPERLVCLVTDAWSRDRGLIVQEVPATTSRLVVVRTSDGAVVADHDVAVGPSASTSGELLVRPSDGTVLAGPSVPAVSLVVLGDVAVLGHPVGPGALLVRGVDVATGEELWRRAAGNGGRPGQDPASLLLRASAGAVVVPGPDGFDLVARDGTLLRHVTAGPGATTARGLGRPGDEGFALVQDGRWRLVTPRRDVPLPGVPLVTVVDDGSAGGLVLSGTPRGLHATESTTGTQRWSVPLAGAESVLVLRGRVHALAPDGVHTYDARTGAPTWQRTHPPRESPAGPVATDGQHLYVPVADAAGTGATRVLRLGLADGRPGTPLAAPRGVGSLWTVADPVIGWTPDGEVVGLR